MSRTEGLTRREWLVAAALSTAPVNLTSAAGKKLRLVDTKGKKVSFLRGNRALFEYCYSAARPKTYVHPLYAPNGIPLTMDSPPDHVHHRGVMLAWSDVKGFDFWGEINPELPHGQVVHQSFEKVPEKANAVTGINNWVANGEVLVVERQTVRAPASPDDLTWLEWESELQPARDAVSLNASEHPYDGLGIRFVHSMDFGKVLTANGTATIGKANGEPSEWATYYGMLEGSGTAGVVIFDHPANPRHPTPFFVMDKPFGYISAAPTFRDPLQLEPGKSIRLRFAVIAYLGEPDAGRFGDLYRRWTSER